MIRVIHSKELERREMDKRVRSYTLLHFVGLSTDTKPTSEWKDSFIANGSKFLVIGGSTYTYDEENSTWVEDQISGGGGVKNYKVYGFYVDSTESDPANIITYVEDAIGMTQAFMNYSTGKFDYGSWKYAFFMPRPCFLKRDGTVDFYLDPNNYAYRIDGTTPSHVGHLGNIETTTTASKAYEVGDYLIYSDTLYTVAEAIESGATLTVDTNITAVANAPTDLYGNAMMEWGRDGKKIWYKIVPDEVDEASGFVYISDKQVDEGYNAWSFINNQGKLADHFYTPIYNGSNTVIGGNNVIRSISGMYLSKSLTGTEEITRCNRNNTGTDVLWNTEVLADRILINFLLMLISKSTNTQSVFGRGLDSGSQSAMEAYVTGSLDDAGLFKGYNDGTYGVKVFGMENYWGCQWRRHAGYVKVNANQKIKLTYGKEDGSNVVGYNTNGADYIDIGTTPTGTSGGYIKKMSFNEYGMFAKDASGSSSTYYCDGLYFNNSATTYACFGGHSYVGAACGAFFVGLNSAVSLASWNIGAAPSCKPKVA